MDVVRIKLGDNRENTQDLFRIDLQTHDTELNHYVPIFFM